jgi:hypothetical protein
LLWEQLTFSDELNLGLFECVPNCVVVRWRSLSIIILLVVMIIIIIIIIIVIIIAVTVTCGSLHDDPGVLQAEKCVFT